MKKYYLLLILNFILWGSGYVASKYVYPFIPPLTVVLLRNLLSGIIFAGFTVFRKIRSRKNGEILKRPPLKHIGLFILIGFMMYAGAVSLTNVATRLLGASMGALLNTLNPVFISLFAVLILKEKLTWRIIAGIAVSLVGVILVLGVSFRNISGLGMVLSITAVILWSIGSVLIRRISPFYEPMEMSMYVTLSAVPFCIIYSCLELRTAALNINVQAVLVILYIAVFCGFAPTLLWNRCLSKIPASTCSMFYPIQPLSATLLGIIILGEKLSWNFFVGGVIICVGVVLGLSKASKE